MQLDCFKVPMVFVLHYFFILNFYSFFLLREQLISEDILTIQGR